VQAFVAAPDGPEDLVPLAFDVRAVRVERRLQARSLEDPLAFGNVGREREPNTDRHNRNVHQHLHGSTILREG
jgi:hypothetical protein